MKQITLLTLVVCFIFIYFFNSFCELVFFLFYLLEILITKQKNIHFQPYIYKFIFLYRSQKCMFICLYKKNEKKIFNFALKFNLEYFYQKEKRISLLIK